MAAGLGFEPRLMEPESIVLPLDDPAVLEKNLLKIMIPQKILLYFQIFSYRNRARNYSQAHPDSNLN